MQRVCEAIINAKGGYLKKLKYMLFRSFDVLENIKKYRKTLE
jgi:hypothetical protein